MTRKSTSTAIIAAAAGIAALVSAAPAFAWSAWIDDVQNYANNQNANSAATLYNYAPGALPQAAVHPAPVRKHKTQ